MIKKLILAASIALLLTACKKQEAPVETVVAPASTAVAPADAKEYEVGCGSCIYKQEGVKGCETWVKTGDKAVKLTGEGIDAHATGLCKSAAHAKLAGEVKDGKFVSTYSELLKEGHSGHDHSDPNHKH